MKPFRSQTSLTLVAAGLVAGLLLSPHTASACDWSPVSLQVATTTVPPAGPLVVDVSCIETDFCKTEEPVVEVRADGDLLAGTTRWLRGPDRIFVAWTPDVPMAVGAQLQASLPDVEHDALVGDPVQVGETDSPAVPALDGAEFSMLVNERPVGDRFCCPGICFPECFTEDSRVTVDMTGPEGLPESPFHLYRFRSRDGDGGGFVVGGYRRQSVTATATFGEPQAELCAVFEALDLRRGTTEERMVCLATPDNLTLGKRVPSRHNTEVLASACSTPPRADGCHDDGPCDPLPEKLMDAWCAAKRTLCEQEGACEALRQCDGEVAVGVPGQILLHGDAGAESVDPEPMSIAEEMSDPAGNDDALAGGPSDKRHARACSLQPGGPGDVGHGYGWLVALSWLAARRARRPRR